MGTKGSLATRAGEGHAAQAQHGTMHGRQAAYAHAHHTALEAIVLMCEVALPYGAAFSVCFGVH